MSVAPDFMLQSSAPDLQLKATTLKTSVAQSSQTGSEQSSSFADVYAKESQATSSRTSENKEAAAKSQQSERSDKPKASDSRDSKVAKNDDTESDEPEVAESGKALPAEKAEGGQEAGDETAADDGSIVDPLLLMALNSQEQPIEESAISLTPDSAGDEMLSAATVTATSGGFLTSGQDEPEIDPQVELLNSLPGVRMALQIEAQTQVAQKGAEQVADGVAGKGDFAQALTAFSGDTVTTEEGNSEKLEFSDLLNDLDVDSSVGKTELQTDNRAEALASKLNALSQAITQQTSAAQRTTVVPGQPVAMQQGGWNEAVVDRVMWLSSQNLKSAEIQLDPAELGRMEVRIQMHQDQTQVTFVSANAGVRDQLEGQAHRLRDMFSANGMGQVDVNVADQSLARGSQGGDDSRRQGGRGGASSDATEELVGGVSEIRSGSTSAPRGLVDYYA
ncbi:flagellar hook-length control protein FliK [Pseudomonas sp. LRF_L74]|uniref:flagellar hook-length control protein FliK n=1 Tax=Pseudomonas sp. LRF_L74 TaxID=3369422 RepID=UPI003F5D6A5E